MITEHRIGYACTPITIPFKTSRSFILKNFKETLFNQCVRENINDLKKILEWNVENEIYMFRISSDTIPFASHTINKIKWWEDFKKELEECGQYIKANKIRVSMHPGQYTVLNSPKDEIVQKSILDLEYHCRFLDSLNIDYTNKIILHVGGVYNNKTQAMKRFIENFSKLSSSMKKRLIIENDDRSYTIEDVLEICTILNIPAVFDNLHHKLNPCSLNQNEIITNVKRTWKKDDGSVKFHYSDQDIIKKGGAHSKTVHTSNFLDYIKLLKGINADIMLEVKDKEISAIKCIHTLKANIDTKIQTDQLAKYKYNVMEKGEEYYKKYNQLIHLKVPTSQVYSFIDNTLCLPFDEKSFRHTLLYIYAFLKERLTLKEDDKLIHLINGEIKDGSKIKNLLQLLCKKYDTESVINSYFFVY